jgi:hypothetical protein
MLREIRGGFLKTNSMETDYSLILLLINYSSQPIDILKELCENYLKKYCNQEGMVFYSNLIRMVAEKQDILI